MVKGIYKYLQNGDSYGGGNLVAQEIIRIFTTLK